MHSLYEAVVAGVSAGGIDALKIFIPGLPASFALPVVIAQHTGPDQDGFLAHYLNQLSPLTVKEAEDKEPMQSGHIYLAPGGYHLLIERDQTFSLSADPRVNFSCPSIDVLFESAADAFGASLIGVILTGANGDGSNGLKTIRGRGGIAIVQNPATAQSRAMPQAALNATQADYIVELEQLAPLLARLDPSCNRAEHESAAY